MTVKGAFRHCSPVFVFLAACAAPSLLLASVDAEVSVDAVPVPSPVSSPSPSVGPKVVRISKHDLQAELSSEEAADGSILLVTAWLPAPLTASDAKLTARFEDRELLFYPMPEIAPNAMQTVLGIPYAHKRGTSEVLLKWRDAGGTEREAELSFTVIDGNYRSEILKVSPRHVAPKPRDLRRIQRESAEIGRIYREITTTKRWKGPFSLPIKSKITSLYGTKRVFNGELNSFHSGLDLRAAVGDPIRAAAPGRVVLAKSLFFTGKTVLLDHGYGVFTIYAHLSAFKVRKGQLVKPSTVLGLAGMTGRASGPHLHWGAVIHRSKVNPAELLKVMR